MSGSQDTDSEDYCHLDATLWRNLLLSRLCPTYGTLETDCLLPTPKFRQILLVICFHADLLFVLFFHPEDGIFLRMELGPLSLVSAYEKLLERKSSGFGPENREYGLGDPLR
jgi:hypothetical protein